MNLELARSYLGRTVSKTRYRAEVQKGIHFHINIDHVMKLLVEQDGKCSYTGWEMEFTRGGDLHGCNPMGCTIDRIDSTKGYVKGNVHLVCWIVNKTKSDLTSEQFLTICESVFKNAKRIS
jgi:hypothetical protein